MSRLLWRVERDVYRAQPVGMAHALHPGGFVEATEVGHSRLSLHA